MQKLLSKLEWDKLARKLNAGPSHIDFKLMWIMAVIVVSLSISSKHESVYFLINKISEFCEKCQL